MTPTPQAREIVSQFYGLLRQYFAGQISKQRLDKLYTEQWHQFRDAQWDAPEVHDTLPDEIQDLICRVFTTLDAWSLYWYDYDAQNELELPIAPPLDAFFWYERWIGWVSTDEGVHRVADQTIAVLWNRCWFDWGESEDNSFDTPVRHNRFLGELEVLYQEMGAALGRAHM